jgi:hypothetical protein
MSKPSKEHDEDTDEAGGGIASAIAQDVELTVEQAEEAAKKAAHKAAIALGLAHDDAGAAPKAQARDGAVDTDTSSAATPSSAPRSKPE